MDVVHFSICLKENPVRYVLRTVWSTHLFNIATHESIYCMFPGSGIDQKVIFLTRFPEAETLRLYQLYVDRGYRRGLSSQAAQLYEFSNDRSVGDIFTRRVRFRLSSEDIPIWVRSMRFAVGADGLSCGLE
jgi:hypothetical protein